MRLLRQDYGMCGRFATTLPTDAMAQLFEAQPANDLPAVPNYNVCPTTQIAVLHGADERRVLGSMRWGFLPHWYKAINGGPLLINARAETIVDKPAFKAAARERRCLIVCAGFYEWTKTGDGSKLPWYIARADHAPLVFGGIWQKWSHEEQPMRTCAIVTTSANSDIKDIHHRMPLVLEPEAWPLWLGEKGHGAARLMVPAEDGILTAIRVGRAVNSNRATGPELILPET